MNESKKPSILEHLNELKPLVDMALIEKPIDESLTKEEIFDLLEMIDDTQFVPVEIDGINSIAQGFMSNKIANLLDIGDYVDPKDYEELEPGLICNAGVSEILNDMGLESETGYYTYNMIHGNKMTIYLSRNI